MAILPTVTHVGDHVAQGLRTARHLQAYIESFHHPQLLLHLRNRCLPWIHSHSCAQLARQIQPEGIHIGHNNMPCPRMTHHRNRHHADRTRARDEDILAEHRERKGSMHRVPERIEDGGDLLIDILSMPPDIGHGQRNEFRKGARSIHAHAKRMRAEMPSPGQAVAAPSTNDMAFAADDVAGIEVINIRSHFDNFPDKFVPNRHGDRNRLLRPIVPLINMDVRSADAGVSDADQDIIDTDGRLWYLFQPEAWFGTPLYQGFHSILQFAATHRSQIIVFAHTVYRKYRMMSDLARCRVKQARDNATYCAVALRSGRTIALYSSHTANWLGSGAVAGFEHEFEGTDGL